MRPRRLYTGFLDRAVDKSKGLNQTLGILQSLLGGQFLTRGLFVESLKLLNVYFGKHKSVVVIGLKRDIRNQSFFTVWDVLIVHNVHIFSVYSKPLSQNCNFFCVIFTEKIPVATPFGF